ncbi:MAG: glycoside hydrolase [Lentisphaerae bacterium]|nr:glycoside hydrolase [Lentisphaerota bacterium]
MQELSGAKHWFHEKRFGMFVHWGIYAVGGIHEQHQMRLHVPAAEYQKFAEQFNPVKFNPAEWLDLAQETGMEYLVFTAKHHDGFCMWNTKETDYNIMHTPYGKDVVGMLAEECHKRNFPLELYYSCVDWHHPAYPNIGRHHEIITDPRFYDMDAYMAFLKRQIRELCTNYGTIHGIWWDMNVPGWRDPSVAEMINSLQPAAVINNRGYGPGDFSTPERDFQAESPYPFAKPTEACDSVGQHSWGYRREEDYFSVRKLERQISLYTALGGNFLLNAGPDATGCFTEKARLIFARIGKWHQKVAQALIAKPCYGLLKLPGIVCTGEGRELNLILLDPPQGESLRLRGLEWMPEKAILLNSGAELSVMRGPETAPSAITLRHLPADRMNDEIQVIRLEFGDDVIHSADQTVYEDKSGSAVQG